jgi:EAL domain-containing protein (putative c-di-GMP-specific phosphodiesterase class I)
VNVSPAQFHKSNLPKVVSETLARTGLPANRLEIEITEGILMAEPEKVSSISLFDGLPITEIDGLPASASRLL